MLVINSPNNPTGWTISQEQQAVVLEYCRRYGIWILADDVYERLVYTGTRSAPSFLGLAEDEDRLLIINCDDLGSSRAANVHRDLPRRQ